MNFKLFCFVVALHLRVGYALKGDCDVGYRGCPLAASIEPCTCQVGKSKSYNDTCPYMYCNRMDRAQLERSTANIDRPIYQMHMYAYKSSSLPDEWLDGKSIKILYIQGSELEVLGAEVFCGSKDLEVVDINDNKKLKEIDAHAFSSLLNVTRVAISGGALEKLVAFDFTPLPHLWRLNLETNQLSEMEQPYLNPDRMTGAFVINLEGNPLNCNCMLRWLRAYNWHTASELGTCAAPKLLARRSVINLDADYFGKEDECPKRKPYEEMHEGHDVHGSATSFYRLPAPGLSLALIAFWTML